jgi:Septum formation
VLGEDRVVSRWSAAVVTTLLAAVLAAGVLLAGCSTGDEDAAPEPRRTTSTAAAEASTPDASALAPTPVLPPDRGCYRLTFDEALAPVSSVPPRSCETTHTARTFHVGRIDDLRSRATTVDSPAVQRAVAADCAERLAGFLGGPARALRLSMLRPVWFTPSASQAGTGPAWYRCDVIALARQGSLAGLERRLEGLLGRPGWQARYGLCGTDEPGTPDFERVACSRTHSWRALSIFTIEGGRYPGVGVVRSLGAEPCTAAARSVAPDPLDFQWGYEWPTRDQWRAGRRYGVCWVPDS